MQKITCKFACFLSSGLGVVDLGKCDGNTDDNADDDTRLDSDLYMPTLLCRRHKNDLSEF